LATVLPTLIDGVWTFSFLKQPCRKNIMVIFQEDSVKIHQTVKEWLWERMKNHFHIPKMLDRKLNEQFLVKVLYCQCKSPALCKVSSSTSQRLSVSLRFGLIFFQKELIQ